MRLRQSGKDQLKKILIADDCQSARDLLRYTLAWSGFEVIEAADGLEVLEKGISSRPDMFILDLDMPRCDGYTVARELRKLSGFAEMPIVALSALASAPDCINLADAGFDLFLRKPISPAKIRECMKLMSDSP